MREHGIDTSLYRTPIEGSQDKNDFAIVCALWGTWELDNWELSSTILRKFKRRAVYGAFRAYVSPELAAQYLVHYATEVGAHFVGLDFEKYIIGKNSDGTYIYYEITAKDVPYLVRWYVAVEQLGMRVVVYGSQSKMLLIQQADPAFFARAELWVAFDEKTADIDNFSIGYRDRLSRPFNSVRIAQYDTHLNGADYGVNFTDPEDRSRDLGLPATTLDGDVYVHEQPMDEWLGITEPEQPEPPEEPGEENDMGILERIEAEIAELKDMQVEANALAVQILALVKDGGGTEPPPAEEPATIGKTVERIRDGERKVVYMFFAPKDNLQGKPIFIIYPAGKGDFANSVYVNSGTVVQVFADGRTVGDSGNVAWKVDKSQLNALGAPLPEDDLFIMEKFII